ncbi:family 16 glycosylhydrolase, partial [Corynebacterium sp. CCM 8862]
MNIALPAAEAADLCIAADTCTEAPRKIVEAGDEYYLVWSDEFNNGVLDEGWNLSQRPVENKNFFYRNKIDPVDGDIRLKDGFLSIVASPRETPIINNKNKPAYINTGGLSTLGKKDWKYGYFEARIRYHSSSKLWPALWFMPTEQSRGWPADGEIDWLETLPGKNNRKQGTLTHTTDYLSRRAANNTAALADLISDKPITGDWHTWSMNWSESGFSFKYDGQEYGSLRPTNPMPPADQRKRGLTKSEYRWPSNFIYVDKKTGEKTVVEDFSPMAPFDRKFFLILNLATLVTSRSHLSAMDFDKSKVDIDYIRVYQTPEQIKLQDTFYLRFDTAKQAVGPDGEIVVVEDQLKKLGESIGDLPVLRNKHNEASFGWYRRANLKPWSKIGNDTAVKDSYILFPKWEEAVWVFKNYSGGPNSPKKQEAFKPGETVRLGKPSPIEQLRFDGWFKDPEFRRPAEEEFVLDSDVTLYAKWVKAQRSVSFVA